MSQRTLLFLVFNFLGWYRGSSFSFRSKWILNQYRLILLYSFNIFSGQLFRERLSQLDGFSKVCTRIDCIALSQDCLPKLLHNRCDFLLSRSFLGGKKFSEVMFRHFKNISRIAFGRVSSSQTIQYVSPGLLNCSAETHNF